MGKEQSWSSLTPEEFPEVFFERFHRHAFRLERLDFYRAPMEAESFQRFIDGKPDDLSWRAGWLEMVRQAVAAGKTMARVHLLSEPWSRYIAFELTRIYPPAVAAGERIRITATGAGLPGHDFWLVTTLPAGCTTATESGSRSR